jgi:hypothetical protein
MSVSALIAFSKRLINLQDEWMERVLGYAWGGKVPQWGLDCNGQVNYILRKAGYLFPEIPVGSYGSHVRSTPDDGWGPIAERVALFFNKADISTADHMGFVIDDYFALHSTRGTYLGPVYWPVYRMLETLRFYATGVEADGTPYIPLGGGGEDKMVPCIQELYVIGDDWSLNTLGGVFGPFDLNKFSFYAYERTVPTGPDPMSSHYHRYGYEDIRVFLNLKLYSTLIGVVLKHIADEYSIYTLSTYGEDLETLVTPSNGGLQGLFEKGSWVLGKWVTALKTAVQASISAISGHGLLVHVDLAKIQQAVLKAFPAQVANGNQLSLWSELQSAEYVKRYLKFDSSKLAGWLDAFTASGYMTRQKSDSVRVVNQTDISG